MSFVLIGNTNRPDGGLFTRFPGLYIPGLNVTFNPPPTPTDTGYATTDIAFQYDPIADFPQFPINLLADINSLAALPIVHLGYPNPYLPATIPLVPTALPGGYTPAQLQRLIVICHGDGATGWPAGRDHLFGSSGMIWRLGSCCQLMGFWRRR